MEQLKEYFIIYVTRHILFTEILDAVNEVLLHGLAYLFAIFEQINGIFGSICPNILEPFEGTLEVVTVKTLTSHIELDVARVLVVTKTFLGKVG